MKKPRIISVINNKGGVGKTTVAVNLAHALSNQKQKILLIDLDSQCNATSTFFDLKLGKTLYDLYYDEEVSISDCIYVTDYPRIHFLPNIQDTAALEPNFLRRPDYGWFLLDDLLREYALNNFDITILDCPPNLGTFSIQAMVASDFIIVPVEAGSRYATDGLKRTIETIEDIASTEGIGRSGMFLKLVINKADRRTSICKISIDVIQSSYEDKVFNTIIPVNTDIQQAELVGKTVLRHASTSNGSKAFRELAIELIDCLNLSDQ